jgi:hypothetical protein
VIATIERVEFTCTRSGQKRTVSERHARRYAAAGQLPEFRCVHCRFGARRAAVDDGARLFWLRQFSDGQLAEMAAAMTRGPLARASVVRRGVPFGP